MPKVKRSRKPPPEGWELIEPTLEELDQKMREAETDSHEGKRKVEALWPIFKIHHQRSRYIFDLFYRRKAISRRKLINISKNCITFIKYLLFRTLRFLHQGKNRGSKLDCQMEETRIRKPLLSTVHSDPRHKFLNQLHL